MRNTTDQAQVSASPLDIRQAGIDRLIRQRMQEDSLAMSHEPHTHAWAQWASDSEHSQRPDAQNERKGNDGEVEQRPGCSQTARLGLADDLSYGRRQSNKVTYLVEIVHAVIVHALQGYKPSFFKWTA